MFDNASVDELLWACRRALALWREPDRWHSVQRAAMAKDFSWEASARRYLDMYRSAYADE